MRAHASRLANRAAPFLDQGFLGLSNLIINILLAHHLPVIDFAAISLMIGLHFIVFSFHRGSIVLPLVLDDSDDAEAGRGGERSEWMTANLCFIALVVCLLVLAALCARAVAALEPRAAWVAQAVGYLAIASPPLLAYEFGRRLLYQQRRAPMAAALSAAYFAAGTGMAALAGVLESPLAGAGAFAAAGCAGAGVFLLIDDTAFAGIAAAWTRWRRYADFAAWQSAASIPSNLYTASAVVLFGAFAGPTAAAVYAVGRTLVSPMLSMTSAVDATDKPRAARALAQGGLDGLRSSIGRTRLTLLVLVAPYFAAVVVLAPWLLGRLFGEDYSGNATVVRVTAVAFLLTCLNQPSETMLVVLRASRMLLAVRSFAALAAVGGTYVGAEHGGVLGAVTAFASVQVLVLALLILSERLLRGSASVR